MGRAMKLKNASGFLAVIAMATSVNIAFTSYASDNLSGFSQSNQINNLATIAQYQQDGVTWANANAANLKAMLGDNFTIKTRENRSIDLKLVDVIEGATDFNRPSFLPRKQSIVAVFEASKSDEAWLAETGSQVTDCWHHELGNEKILITAIKRRSGGHSIELVLN